jgi:hypothetical protein
LHQDLNHHLCSLQNEYLPLKMAAKLNEVVSNRSVAHRGVTIDKDFVLLHTNSVQFSWN